MSQTYCVEVRTKDTLPDVRGESLLKQVAALGINTVSAISVADLYFIKGDVAIVMIEQLVQELLYDPVVETVIWFAQSEIPNVDNVPNTWLIETTFLPGVTDSVAESLRQGAEMMGLHQIHQAATGQRFTLTGNDQLTEATVRRIADQLLINDVIQTYQLNDHIAPPFVNVSSQLSAETALTDLVEFISITEADDAELQTISQERRLSLNLLEMQAVQRYYQSEGREPTDVELETVAQTWSEHCVHKTFKARISYEGPDKSGAIGHTEVESLLSTYIRAATDAANKPWIRSAFVDNAGIVAFNEDYDLAFKVETHNHPSALEPFGGANTGIGGVVRDIVGVSARPIANTDVLCFGPQDMDFANLPDGVLHPRRIADGVIAGIEDYGNKMGIPTVNGTIFYDEGYIANPLVFCGCLGILPRNSHRTEPQVDDLVIVIGGHTGRDGLRGATFSSMEMSHETSEIAGTAVQIGHPIHEKQTLEAIIQARDEGLYTAITDCGAGGLSSAIGEMSSELGAEIYLERVPLKYPGLLPWEIWLSEAQERMVLAVPPTSWPRLQEICQGLDISATSLGHFTGNGRLTLYYHHHLVGQFANDFLHDGIPLGHLQATWSPAELSEPSFAEPLFLTAELLALLAAPNTCSKEAVVRQYDHEVQGGTVVKPFAGALNIGPNDAAVLNPLDTAQKAESEPTPGVALAVGINPAYGEIDPYAMAWAAIDEAVRNCVAVGADPDQLSILDNFCWGNPNLPDRLGALVRCSQGCYDAAVAYGLPYISGKDSLNNEYTGRDGVKRAIPGTLLISAMGIVPDVSRTATTDLKGSGNRLYIIGETRNELGGSTYYQKRNVTGANVPQPPEQGLAIFRALHQAIATGLVASCHDCSEGGLAVAAAEMALAGGLGLELNLADVTRSNDVQRNDTIAFSESLGRFLVEVADKESDAFEAHFTNLPFAQIGQVRKDAWVQINGLNGKPVIETDLKKITLAWRGNID
ncbi:MAG: phosphoribosylformylglycinamidine synthase subunit PurL [Chloroflexota bacterium]